MTSDFGPQVAWGGKAAESHICESPKKGGENKVDTANLDFPSSVLRQPHRRRIAAGLGLALSCCSLEIHLERI